MQRLIDPSPRSVPLFRGTQRKTTPESRCVPLIPTDSGDATQNNTQIAFHPIIPGDATQKQARITLRPTTALAPHGAFRELSDEIVGKWRIRCEAFMAGLLWNSARVGRNAGSGLMRVASHRIACFCGTQRDSRVLLRCVPQVTRQSVGCSVILACFCVASQ